MMKNLSSWASVLLLVLFAASEARAQYSLYGPTSLCAAYRRSYDENVAWPSQFIPASRRPVRNTYETVISNGWRRQNLLGDYHFESDTNKLTEAGKLKVKWILTQTPVHRRSIFVQRAADQSQTASRVASVHGLAMTMSPSVGPLDVNDTHIVAEGHPASAVDNLFIGYQSNLPAPVLPAASGSSSSSSSGN